MPALLLIFIFIPPAHGEYRAYSLLVRNTQTGTERIALSTLDHIQYPGYYPLMKDEVVEYVASWRCRGRTGGFKKICADPADSQPKPNSTALPTP